MESSEISPHVRGHMTRMSRPHGESPIFSTMVLRKLDIHMQKNKVGLLPKTIYENYPKMDQRPECKTKNYKLLEVGTGQKLHTLYLAMFSWIRHQRHRQQKKIDKLYFTKIKNFCALKDTINRVKRQPTNRRRYLQITYLIRINIQNI